MTVIGRARDSHFGNITFEQSKNGLNIFELLFHFENS